MSLPRKSVSHRARVLRYQVRPEVHLPQVRFYLPSHEIDLTIKFVTYSIYKNAINFLTEKLERMHYS